MTRFTRLAALSTVLLLVLAVASPALGERAESKEVSIKGTVTSEHTVESDPVPSECAGFDWKFSGLGTGKLSHLGKVDFSLEHCTTSDSPTESRWENGTITFTAPNGDTLILTETGDSVLEFGDTPGPPLGFTYEGEWVVDSGTGMFYGASGDGTLEGYGTIPGNVPDALMLHFEGSITYSSGQPFRGSFWGDDVSFNFDVPEGRCVEMADVADSVTRFTGEGVATHMGPVTIVAEHCSDLDTGRYGDGLLMITADNGDVLMATYTSGMSLTPPPLIEFTDEVTFVDGGTGRFTHASGGALESGVFNFNTFEWSVYTEGTISYSK